MNRDELARNHSKVVIHYSHSGPEETFIPQKEESFKAGYDAADLKAKQIEIIGDGLWKALEAVAHKAVDRGTQRFAISELLTYKQTLAKIKGETNV